MQIPADKLAEAKAAMDEASRKLYDTVKQFHPKPGDFDGWRTAQYDIQEREFEFRTKKLDYEALLFEYLYSGKASTTE